MAEQGSGGPQDGSNQASEEPTGRIEVTFKGWRRRDRRRATVAVDNIIADFVHPGEEVSIDVTAGPHELWVYSGIGKPRTQTVELEVPSGQTVSVLACRTEIWIWSLAAIALILPALYWGLPPIPDNQWALSLLANVAVVVTWVSLLYLVRRRGVGLRIVSVLPAEALRTGLTNRFRLAKALTVGLVLATLALAAAFMVNGGVK